MPSYAIAIPCVRLTSDAYSAPEGSHGFITDEYGGGARYAVHWIPPHGGSSVPVQAEDLEQAAELMIPTTMLPAEPSERAVLALARRRAGGWMPKDYREANEQRIIDEAREDLRVAMAADRG